jgi:hypothetical protein
MKNTKNKLASKRNFTKANKANRVLGVYVAIGDFMAEEMKKRRGIGKNTCSPSSKKLEYI